MPSLDQPQGVKLWVKSELLRIYQTEARFINQERIAEVVSYWKVQRPKMYLRLEAEEKGLARKLADILLHRANQEALRLMDEEQMIPSEANLVANQDLMLQPED